MAERGQSEAIELVKQGHALIKIENDAMLQVAVQRPREEERIAKAALAELDLIPEKAEAAFYSIPFKERQADGSVVVRKVEGPSVRAARSLARRWGNCSAGDRLVNEDPEGYDVEGVFIDLETNFRIMRQVRVSKYSRRKSGAVELLPLDAMLRALQAGLSKASRNAILAGLPSYLIQAYYRKAREIAMHQQAPADKPTEKMIKAVGLAFEKMKISLNQLEEYLGKSSKEWTADNIADLRGLYNGIQDGQVSIEDLWPKSESTERPTSGDLF